MVKLHNSLMFRITFSFLLLVVVITGLTYVYTFTEAKQALRDTVKNQLKESVIMVASQITPEMAARFASYKEGAESTPEYAADIAFLSRFEESSKDIFDLYFFKKVDDKLVYQLDALIYKSPKDAAPAAMEFPPDDRTPMTDAAFDSPQVEDDIAYYESWGYLISAYAPIKGADGKTIGVIGADMNVDTYLAKVHFLGNLIYFIMGASILAAAILVAFFSFTIIRDIKAMSAVAQKLSAGELDFDLPTIKSRNEIHELNEGLKSVIAAVEMLREAAGAAETESATKRQEVYNGR